MRVEQTKLFRHTVRNDGFWKHEKYEEEAGDGKKQMSCQRYAAA